MTEFDRIIYEMKLNSDSHRISPQMYSTNKKNINRIGYHCPLELITCQPYIS